MIVKRTWDTYPPTYHAREVAIIAEWVAAGESGVIAGTPGVGKSNLFGFLSRQPQALKPYLPEPDLRLVLALVDLNNLPGHDLSTFYRIMLRAMYESRGLLAVIALGLAETVETLYHTVAKETDPFVSQSALREALFAFESCQTRLVLLLDPFDRLAQTAPAHILDNLRGLRDSFKATLSYLVGVRQPLHYLRPPSEMGELYHVLDLHLCWVGAMAAADARFLMANVAATKRVTFAAADIEQLLELTGGYAALLKAASLWLAGAKSPPPQAAWPEHLLAEPGMQNRLHDLWQSLTGEEQLTLAELAQQSGRSGPGGAGLAEPTPQILSRLQEKQICRRTPAGDWRIFSPLLTAYINQLGLIETGKIHYRATDDVILRGHRSLEQQLTPQNRTLLRFFLQHPYKIVSKDELVAVLWSDEEIYEGVNDVRLQKAVSQLRRVLETGEEAPCYLKTIHGQGYRFFPEGAPRG